ncbi:unnamed protein product [Macrosiphum euphorbiae]|uniref:Uncharacterized protein n=1 Tax=Macrosiphum euphorbiae TaxID=13131 RepID=A0AAV0VTE6_9HEMI|nr:unnamed protein product [Macrosiphum euphorbiae]
MTICRAESTKFAMVLIAERVVKNIDDDKFRPSAVAKSSDKLANFDVRLNLRAARLMNAYPSIVEVEINNNKEVL